jgi:hypothetical protein
MDSPDTIVIADYPLTPVIATSIKISILELVLNSHVTVTVSFFDANGSILKNETVKIEGAEYTAWGVNDTYLTGLVLQKLGLSLPA